MGKIIGIKIDTKSPKTKDKIYYYSTEKDFKRGDKINVKTESGGTPNAVVVVGNSQKKISHKLKKLEEV